MQLRALELVIPGGNHRVAERRAALVVLHPHHLWRVEYCA